MWSEAGETDLKGAEPPAPSEWLTPIKSRRTFEEILAQLESALLAGKLTAGARLPAERDLAAALGVSRPSVREALRVLEALGLLDVQRGPGGATLRQEPGDAFERILGLHLALGHYSPPSVVEFRCILESWAFQEAARSGDAQLHSRLDLVLERMGDGSIDQPTFNRLDLEFHSAVIESCGNELAALMHHGLRSVVRQEMYEGLAAGSWHATMKELYQEHHRLYESIQQGQAEAAGHLVVQHIRKWAERALRLGTMPGAQSSVDARRSPS